MLLINKVHSTREVLFSTKDKTNNCSLNQTTECTYQYKWKQNEITQGKYTIIPGRKPIIEDKTKLRSVHNIINRNR